MLCYGLGIHGLGFGLAVDKMAGASNDFLSTVLFHHPEQSSIVEPPMCEPVNGHSLMGRLVWESLAGRRGGMSGG